MDELGKRSKRENENLLLYFQKIKKKLKRVFLTAQILCNSKTNTKLLSKVTENQKLLSKSQNKIKKHHGNRPEQKIILRNKGEKQIPVTF